MALRRIDHVGVDVTEMAGPLSLLEEIGFTIEQEIDISGRIEAKVLRADGAGIELVRHLGAPNPQGYDGYHVGIEVDDLDELIGRLRAKGVETTSRTASTGSPNRSYFTLPQTSRGIPLQLFERR